MRSALFFLQNIPYWFNQINYELVIFKSVISFQNILI